MVNASYQQLAHGDAGTIQTLELMREFVRSRVAHLVVRLTAVSLAADVQSRNVTGQIYAIRDFLESRVVFLRDPAYETELVHAPEVLLGQIATQGRAFGDCDDVAVLGAALGGAIGIPGRFIVAAFFDESHPMSHVYAELFDGSRWIELDTTRPMQVAAPVARTWRVDI